MHMFVCLVFDEWFVKTFFHLHPGYKNKKTYPVLDLPVYRESDGANFILVRTEFVSYDCLFKFL